MSETFELSAEQSTDQTTALERLSTTLRAADDDTRVLHPSDDVPLPALLVALGIDEENRNRTLAISVLPFAEDDLDATAMMQFYVSLPFQYVDATRTDVLAATAHVNGAMAIGHVAARGDELYDRYVLASDKGLQIDGESVTELVQLIDFHQRHLGDYLEGILTNELSLQVLPAVIAESACASLRAALRTAHRYALLFELRIATRCDG